MPDFTPDAQADALSGAIPNVMTAAVVGLSNSGKTTLLTRLVAHFAKQGVRLAIIKHDGHAQTGALPVWQLPQSDTARALAAGASYVMVAGAGHSLVQQQADAAADDPIVLRDRLLRYARISGNTLDGVLFEGFKSSDLPKLVLARQADQLAWARGQALTNVVGYVLSEQVLTLADPRWRVYHEDDIAEIGAAVSEQGYRR
jgi:molybdopterin-guanine dinucleotide biosynthesis adapter protein